jgi:hypothetical protein
MRDGAGHLDHRYVLVPGYTLLDIEQDVGFLQRRWRLPRE